MRFRGHAPAAFLILKFWSSQKIGPGLGLGPGPGWALAGWAKNEGVGKAKYRGLEFLRGPNGKPPPGMDRYGPGDAKNLGFD